MVIMLTMNGFRNKSRLLCLSVLLLAFGLGKSSAQQDITSWQVKAAVYRSVAWLRQQQQADGSWSRGPHTTGNTALAVLSLLHAGVSVDDPTIQLGINYLNQQANLQTYTVSLKCQVYALAGPVRYRRQLLATANYLVAGQKANGMWSYTKTQRGGDNSNTQFALLGLHEAAKAGVVVPKAIWVNSKKHFSKTQNNDGGWGYRGGLSSTGSMTTAGLSSLYICGQKLLVGGAKVFRNGKYPSCGKYLQDIQIRRGLNWLGRRFSVSSNPGTKTWLYYYLYGLERVGMLSGLREMGSHDWYREGAAELVRRQQRGGQWSNEAQTYDTAFALLFLAKGNRPVLIQKIKWEGNWNRNVNDLENFTSIIGDSLGKRTTWQTTSLDMPMEELRLSPILFITGHTFPKFKPEQIEKLKKYVDEAGGTLLFEACCGEQPFADGFREFAKKTWPDYQLRPLELDHPVFNSMFKLDKTYGLEGVGLGCRTGVLFSPNALSCLWELQTVPESKYAFQLGANIAAYATGSDQLRDKLDIVELPKRQSDQPGPRVAEIPRGAVRIARLIHNGDYNADPRAMVQLASLLREKAAMDFVAQSRHLRASDKKIFEYPIVFMNGHHEFQLPDADIEGLRDYLEKGGFLMASNCCGRAGFDKAFRTMVKKLFPDKQFTPLPAEHPIYSGKTGIVLGELQYRPILARKLKQRGTNRPLLEVLEIDGRPAILYSKYDYCCALEGDRPFSCFGYADEDGKKLAMAIFLYAIRY